MTTLDTQATSAEALWHDRQREYAWLMIQWIGCWLLLLGIAAAFSFRARVVALLLGEDLFAAVRNKDANERGASPSVVAGNSLSPPPTITSVLPSPLPTVLEKK